MALNNVVLYEPEIPQNTGNVMRTCAGTNTLLHLIKPLGFALDEKHLIRAAVNYVPNVDFIVYENWEDFLKKNPDGVFYYYTRYGFKDPSQMNCTDLSKKYYYIIGKESTGIPKEILKDHLDFCIRIPTNDKIRALNMSNCVAIALFEGLRQQNYPDLSREEPETLKGHDWLLK